MAETKKRKVFSDEAEACDVESDDYGIGDEMIVCEEEESKKKLVYIISADYGPLFNLKLSTVDPHSSTPRAMDKTHLLQKNPPTDFGEIRYADIAALESKLYFIGGIHPKDRTKSNKVFAFDTASEAWDTPTAIADMKQTRFGSTVLTFQNKIYVFGSDNYSIRNQGPLLPQHWAEFYDPKTNKWEYLPDTPPEVLTEENCSTLHVLIEEYKIVLFCVAGTDFYGYSFANASWFHASPSSDVDLSIRFIGRWCQNVVVINSSLFWHSAGSIYRYDLESDTKATAAAPICTIQQSLQSGRPATPVCAIQQATLPGRFSQSFFSVDAGNGKFCLVHRCDRLTVCQTFGLPCPRFPKQSDLRSEGFITCRDTVERIYAVFAIARCKKKILCVP